ncbi:MULTISPECIES: nucleotidyltransferase family protein [unclassified Caulobacter]|uniref:nucleotidyltransferase family protein n=1 Tax=unclassified Caulobacter TaxID=2648921 RepID=UPI000785D544|nr:MULTISPECIES: nucleotidyltransferase family protein [unclassified Caulobacter]AZS22683.1 nucleotidyltransferase family protein [Caulobacter sp. FWC26]
MTTNLEDRFIEIVRGVPTTMRVLETVRALDLPDWMVFSGAVYQPVWNQLTGRAPDYGIKDYDVAYHDDSDTSYEAEDVVIKRVAAAFEPPLRDLVEVRNQARVHLWFNKKFGADEPYPPLENSAAALKRFVATAFCVGVRLEPDDRLSVWAPFGLEDLFALRLRPNPLRVKGAGGWERTTASAKARWPEISIEP